MPPNWRDRVWLAWFAIQLPVILCVDVVEKYPDWLCASPGAPLHALHRFRLWYIAQYNDPIMQWTPERPVAGAGGSWIPLFFWLELLFALPTVAYVFYRLAAKPSATTGTTGPLELLMLVYALETALTTAVCIYDVAYWDPAVYSPAAKAVFRFQLYGPWLLMPTLLFADMYARLLARLAVDQNKKTQ